MNRGEKKQVTAILLGIMILIGGTMMVSARVFANAPSCAYQSSDCTSGGDAEGVSGVNSYSNMKETLVIRSAGYMLEAYAKILTFANRFELSDIQGYDANSQRDIYYSALDRLERSIAIYSILIQETAANPYNKYFVNQLSLFNYDKLQFAKNLNPSIFNEVKLYLGKGDVLAALTSISKKMETTRDYLYSFQHLIDSNQMPTNEMVWKANNLFAETILFGQYCSEVFYSINI